MNWLPNLGTLVLITNSTETAFSKNEKGNLLMPINDTVGIEINHYVFLEWYYGRIIHIDAATNTIEVEGHIPLEFATPPSVCIFSFPQIIQQPPPNTTSVFYTIICDTDWENQEIVCIPNLPETTPTLICNIYTLGSACFTVYDRKYRQIEETYFNLFYLNVECTEYKYPPGTFVAFYETPITKLITTSSLNYTQLLTTAYIENVDSISSTITLSKDISCYGICEGCLLAICRENDILWYEVETLSSTNINAALCKNVSDTLPEIEKGTLAHIIYLYSTNSSLKPYSNDQLQNKTRPEGSILQGITTISQMLSPSHLSVVVMDTSAIFPGTHMSINNGEHNEYKMFVVSVNHTTKEVFFSTSISIHHHQHPIGTILQIYSFYVGVPNNNYYVDMKTIKWIDPEETDYQLFPGISTAGSVSIYLHDVSSIEVGMTGVITASKNTIEYIQVVDVNTCCSTVYINKPLQFNHTEYEGILFFILPKTINQYGVSLQNILFNSTPVSAGGSIISVNPTSAINQLQSGQFLIMDPYGTTEISTVYSNISTSTTTTANVSVFPPFAFTHEIGSAIITYAYVIPELPLGTTKTDQQKITGTILPGENWFYLHSVSNIAVGSYLTMGYVDYAEHGFKVMNIDLQKKKVFVDNIFTKYYYTNTLCQFYKYPSLIDTQNATPLLYYYTTETAAKGTNILKMSSMNGITIGTKLQIGTTRIECKTVEDHYGNTVVVDTSFEEMYDVSTLVQLYVKNTTTLPKDSVLLATTYTTIISMGGDISLTLANSSLCVPYETYLLIDVSPFVETAYVCSVNNQGQVSLSLPITNTHNAGSIVQVFKYIDAPKGAYLKTRTTLTAEIPENSSTLFFNTSTIPQIEPGTPLYIQVGSAECMERDLMIVNIYPNRVDINKQLAFYHSAQSSLCVYTYTQLPANSALVTLMQTVKPAKKYQQVLKVSSVRAFITGNTYYVQLGIGDTIETDLKIDSVNITTNEIILSTPLLQSHLNDTTLQIYLKDIPDLPAFSLNPTAYVLEENVEYGSVSLNVASSNGIICGTYGLIDVGELMEYFTVMDVYENKITIKLQLSYSHRCGSIIQFFNVAYPPKTKIIDYKRIYDFIKLHKTDDPLTLVPEADIYQALLDYKSLFMNAYTYSTDAQYLVQPLLQIMESRCLTFVMDTSTSSLSAYVPFYRTIKYYYSELQHLSKYDPTSKVIALRFIIQDVAMNILPLVESSNVTNISQLLENVQQAYYIYYQLYSSQKRLEAYLSSLNIRIVSNTPFMKTSELCILPFLELSFGCLIGSTAGLIGMINEPGTVYSKPYVFNDKLIIIDTVRMLGSVNPGNTLLCVQTYSDRITIDAILFVDIGIAQEEMKIKEINGTTILLESPFKYPHNENAMVFICSKTKPITFVLNEFTSDFRMIQELEINSQKYDLPTSTFMAYGNISAELFRNTFLFGTSTLMGFSENECDVYASTSQLTMGFYVDSSGWNDANNALPKMNFSKLKCKSGHYQTSTYTTAIDPELATLQTTALLYNIFNVVDSISLAKNIEQVSESISFNFSKYIWNNVYGAILWTQDYRRKPLETIVTETQVKQSVNFTNEHLIGDPVNPGMSFIPEMPNTGSITQKLFSQLIGGDITRLQGAKLYKGTPNVYHFPFIEGDTIVFKVNVKYAIDNVYKIVSSMSTLPTDDTATTTPPQNLLKLNARFNEGSAEHTDYNSYTVVLTLV